MLGYCPDCGLYHRGTEAAAFCDSLKIAVGSGDEGVAWSALKRAVAREKPALRLV